MNELVDTLGMVSGRSRMDIRLVQLSDHERLFALFGGDGCEAKGGRDLKDGGKIE